VKWQVSRSSTHGNGIFAKENIFIGESVGDGITRVNENEVVINFERNVLGLMINHSEKPNVQCVMIDDDIHLVAIENIPEGEEIYVSYAQYEKFVDNYALETKKTVNVL
jgi:hypothetical protein